jgi:hypothetical protein
MKEIAFVIFKCRTIPKEAHRPEVFLVAGGNRHEDYCGTGMFGQAGECGVGREELNLDCTAVFACQTNEGTLLRRRKRVVIRIRLIKVGLTPAKDHDAAPFGVEHARCALREALQKPREVPRLSCVNGKLHQFIGFAIL